MCVLNLSVACKVMSLLVSITALFYSLLFHCVIPISQNKTIQCSTEAGQALREDAPDVRKVIDVEIQDVGPFSSPQQHPMQYRPPPPGSVPSGIPPAVSYSPNTGGHPHPLPSPQQQHQHRPDPPEAEGVTGYRQPPLNYQYDTAGSSGRGGGGSGRGPPHHAPHQQYQQGGPGMHPSPPHGYPHQPPPHHQQRYPPSNYYGQPPPPQFQQPQQHHPSPQNQQHFPQALPQFRQNNNQYNAAYSTQPRPQHKKTSFSDKLHDPTNAVHSAIEAVKQRLPGKDSLPTFMSTATDFTMSDVSSFAASNITKSYNDSNEIFQGAVKRGSNSTKSGSGNSKQSFNMSDLSLSGLGFSTMGRTRSFPDLMLSTGDINLLPALPDESGGDSDDVTPQRMTSGRIMRPAPHARQGSSGSGSSASCSMASLTIRGFHPVRGRANTQNTTSAMSGLHDAMSIMSIDSHKLSMKSDNSSWMENLKSMQSIHSDGRNAFLHHDDAGSVRSLLSDISNDLNALDLAEPLLPPFPTDQSFSDSEFMVRQPRPDP